MVVEGAVEVVALDELDELDEVEELEGVDEDVVEAAVVEVAVLE